MWLLKLQYTVYSYQNNPFIVSLIDNSLNKKSVVASMNLFAKWGILHLVKTNSTWQNMDSFQVALNLFSQQLTAFVFLKHFPDLIMN